jgi:hypothetical protein
MAQIKITSATMINGSAVSAGETLEIDDRLAKDLFRRGRAVPAGDQEKGDQDPAGDQEKDK